MATSKNTKKQTTRTTAKPAYDVTAVETFFDPNAYIEFMNTSPVMKMFEGFKLPGLDTQIVTDAQRKNVQAIADAGRVAAEGYKPLFEKQAAFFKDGVAEMTEVAQKLYSVPMTAETVEQRVEVAKAQFEKGAAAFAELSETARKANEDAFKVVRARFDEAFAEMKDFAESSLKAAA